MDIDEYHCISHKDERKTNIHKVILDLNKVGSREHLNVYCGGLNWNLGCVELHVPIALNRRFLYHDTSSATVEQMRSFIDSQATKIRLTIEYDDHFDCHNVLRLVNLLGDIDLEFRHASINVGIGKRGGHSRYFRLLTIYTRYLKLFEDRKAGNTIMNVIDGYKKFRSDLNMYLIRDSEDKPKNNDVNGCNPQ